MIREELYHKTVGILYDAYFNDTLRHSDCGACAVGNIVAANNGIKNPLSDAAWANAFMSVPFFRFYSDGCGWPSVFCTITDIETTQKIHPENYTRCDEARKQIDSTGYIWQELAKIEYAFETADKGNNDEDYMFNGLVAVLEVLKEIHQVEDEDLLTQNKSRFEKHYETLKS